MELPDDAARLLASSPEEFVEERKRIAAKLRDEGRPEDARAVAEAKKPPAVVLAVNRAVRDRPQAAKDAADATTRLGPLQLSGEQKEYASTVDELERASRLVADVAVAHLSRTKTASDSMRRRVNDLIRGALASAETRPLFVRGVLTDEIETTGFDAFAGLAIPPAARAKPKSRKDLERAERARAELQKEIAAVRKELADADRRVREVTRERDRLAKKLGALEAKHERTG